MELLNLELAYTRHRHVEDRPAPLHERPRRRRRPPARRR
jgi:hypothetical protein